MPFHTAIINCGISLFCITTLSAQDLTNQKPLQKAVRFQEYQQKNWRVQHLPKNSFFLSPALHYTASLDTLPVPEPDLSRWVFICGTTGRSDESSLVQADLQARRLEYCHWQKESWWRERSNETISLFLKDILSNIHITRQ